MNPFEFTFRGKSSAEFGIMASSYDFLLPTKRERKMQIPFRSGMYDFGARWYDERILRLQCVWINDRRDNHTRADIREISYWLSGKGSIVLAIEPDKRYVGALYDETDLLANINYANEMRTSDGSFELSFVCEPFAYGDQVDMPLESGSNRVEYKGTAETPCLIILRNNSNFTIHNVQIIATRRRA